ncbi:MAG: hypothetical protein RSD99_18130, partial [Janthinobacterium sp.]
RVDGGDGGHLLPVQHAAFAPGQAVNTGLHRMETAALAAVFFAYTCTCVRNLDPIFSMDLYVNMSNLFFHCQFTT